MGQPQNGKKEGYRLRAGHEEEAEEGLRGTSHP